MMRTNLQPLAGLVDAIAEKWLAVEDATAEEQAGVRAEITGSFNIGDRNELTFHGLKYLLTVARAGEQGGYLIDVHKIELNA